MNRYDFYYDLPSRLIAQDPLEDRASSRLLVLDKDTGRTEHKSFRDITEYLHKGDCLVLNNTKVIPARLIGTKKGNVGQDIENENGAHIEVLLLKRREKDIWECLVKPGKRCRQGARLSFGDGILNAEVLDTVEEGNRLIRFSYEGIFEEVLDRLGEMPLPPYITHKLVDRERYQTVYAKYEGSAAAPTAGLHFTKELLDELGQNEIKLAYVTLHVGLGTFKPVKEENIEDHVMHSEYYSMSELTADRLNLAKKEGRRIIAVGTTSTRTLETIMNEYGEFRPCSGNTSIFIYPPYEFRSINCQITNFHLPKSTLIMMIAAQCSREMILNAYKTAVEEKYRFFSFGDSMFLTNE